MSDTPLGLTRAQLAEFLPNLRAIRAFEQLLKQVGELIPENIDSLTTLVNVAVIGGATAGNKAEEALGHLATIAQALALISQAPVLQPATGEERVDPVFPPALPADDLAYPTTPTSVPDDLSPPAGIPPLATLPDVGVSAPAAGNVLIYNAALQQWVNALLTQGANVTITNADGAVTIAVSGLGTMATQAANSVNITGGSATLANLTVDSTSLYVDSTNHRVGIKNTAPLAALQIGTSTNTGATLADSMLFANYSTTAQHRYLFNHAGSGYWGLGSDGVSAFIIGKASSTAGAVSSTYVIVDSSGNTQPGSDNSLSCGTASKRWSVVYAGTGTINTSDAREKTEVRDLTQAETGAALRIAAEIGVYQFLTSVKEKGDAARLHAGLTVQKAVAIMQEYGLDPFAYGFICYDKWDAQYAEKVDPDGELVRTIERQKVIPQEVQEIQIIDGKPRLIATKKDAPVFEMLEVTDSEGSPVTDDQGEAVLYSVPVMEQVEERYSRVIVREAGDRYSFRTDELSLFILKGLYHDHDRNRS